MKNEKTKYSIKLYNIKTQLTTEHELITIEGLHPTNHHITWDIQFNFFGAILEAKNEFMLSCAIDKIREVIEPQHYRMLVGWSELNAIQSGMLGDMSAGALTYKVERVDNKSEYIFKSNKDEKITFHVLEETTIQNIASIEEQKLFHKQYINSFREKSTVGLKKNNSTITSWIRRILKK